MRHLLFYSHRRFEFDALPANNLRCAIIFLGMVYGEDVKRIFRERGESLVGCEVSLFGTSALVISGHRGLSVLSPEEIIVRRHKGSIRITGKDLRLQKASPLELYISGEIRVLEYSEPGSEVGV